MGFLDTIFGRTSTKELVAETIEFAGQPSMKPAHTIIAEIKHISDDMLSLYIYDRTNNDTMLHDVPMLRKTSDDDNFYMSNMFNYSLWKEKNGYTFHYNGQSAPVHTITFKWR